MTHYFIGEEGPLAGHAIALEAGDSWVLGRDPEEATILLEDPMVSRRHAICTQTESGLILENLSTINPITCNGQVLREPQLLHEGDLIQIGSTLFRFTSISPSTEEEPAAFEEVAEDLSTIHVESLVSTRWLLKVISGPNAGAEFYMSADSTYILGKDPHLCDIVFQDLSVSRQHARISIDADQILSIEDLGSRNGILINGELIHEKTVVSSQDLLAIGTTSFLLIDQEMPEETVIATAPPIASKQEAPTQETTVEKKPTDWKKTIISTRMLITAGALSLCVLSGLGIVLALFHSKPIVVEMHHPEGEIRTALDTFPDVQFSFNAANGKLFLVGHVLTTIDKQELLYKVKNIPFITQIDDNVVVDEYVWQNMNGLLQSNTAWQGVAIYSISPGRFVIKGYLPSAEQAEALSDYLNLNFPYLDRLDNQVVIETNLQIQIQSALVEKGFSGVTFQLNNGDLVLAGRVDQQQTVPFTGTVEFFKGLNGIRSVKNFVIYTTTDTSRIDLSAQYAVSGYSATASETNFIVINGKILSSGDLLDGMVITQIQPSTVLLEKDGIKFRINYNLQ